MSITYTQRGKTHLEAPRFWSVQYEIVEGCNRSCSFCGIHSIREKGKDWFTYKYMDVDMYEGTLRQIAEMHDSPRIEYDNHGEPTLHPKFPEMVKMARDILPGASLQVQTNGDMLFTGKIWSIIGSDSTTKKVDAIIEYAKLLFDNGLNMFALDAYNETMYKAIRENYQRIADETGSEIHDSFRPFPHETKKFNHYHKNDGRHFIVVDDLDRVANDPEVKVQRSKILLNEGGNTPEAYLDANQMSKADQLPYEKSCTRVFREITFGWNGVVSACCYDWKNGLVMGKAPEMTVQEIWHSKTANAMRYLLGKETKFRNFSPCDTCFSGDTRVKLADGTSPTFQELVGREYFYVYSIDDKGVTIEKGHSARLIQKDAELLKVTLDTGESIKCTPDHKFITRDGQEIEASNLIEGTSLMPFYLEERPHMTAGNPDSKLYEYILDPISQDWVMPHFLADKYNLRLEVYDEIHPCHRHHIDFDTHNNSPENITRMTPSDHNRLHGTIYANSPEGRARNSKTMTALHNDPEFAKAHSERSSSRLTQMNSDPEFQKRRSEGLTNNPNFKAARKEQWNKPGMREDHSKFMSERNKKPGFQESAKYGKVKSLCLKAHYETGTVTKESYEEVRDQNGAYPRWETAVSQYGEDQLTALNHTVVNVEPCEPEDVYCLTVDTTHNFALDSGVFVKNCDYNGGGRIGLLSSMTYPGGKDQALDDLYEGMKPFRYLQYPGKYHVDGKSYNEVSIPLKEFLEN